MKLNIISQKKMIIMTFKKLSDNFDMDIMFDSNL
jgi:hypothetical protein